MAMRMTLTWRCCAGGLPLATHPSQSAVRSCAWLLTHHGARYGAATGRSGVAAHQACHPPCGRDC
eukprot:278381-Chlamydomonas_euryale.AAC.15